MKLKKNSDFINYSKNLLQILKDEIKKITILKLTQIKFNKEQKIKKKLEIS